MQMFSLGVGTDLIPCCWPYCGSPEEAPNSHNCPCNCAKRVRIYEESHKNRGYDNLPCDLYDLYEHSSKSFIVQIVLVIPAAMHGVILTAVLTLTKLYHATQSETHAL